MLSSAVVLGRLILELPRFDGHLILCMRGARYSQDKDSEPSEAVRAGISAAGCRAHQAGRRI